MALMSDSSPSPASPSSATAASSRRQRRPGVLIGALAVLIIFSGSGIWYTTDIILARPIVSGGFVSGTTFRQDDPLLAPEYHVPYRPNGTVQVAVMISNVGNYAANIQKITFIGVPTPSDHYVSPLRMAKPLYAPDMISGELKAFRPFTIDPDKMTIVGWDLTMCPTQTNLGGSRLYDRFGVTYSYGGWTRTDEVVMPTALSIDNIGKCDGNGNPPSR